MKGKRGKKREARRWEVSQNGGASLGFSKKKEKKEKGRS